jgi:hypothetical protein
VRAAHQVRENYPDGQLWAELTTPDGRPVPPGVVLGDFLRAAAVPASCIPEDVDERARMFRSWAANRRLLVVLDDAADLDQLLPLLPGGSESATLLTCRRRLSDPRITATVATAPLSPAMAWHLLADTLGEARLASEAEAIATAIRLCEGLPGALRTVASWLERRPHWSVARMLGQRTSRACRALSPAGPDLVSVVRRTHQFLKPSTQSAFRVLATATDEWISAAGAGALLGVPEPEAEALLEDLVEVRLAEVHLEPGSEDFSYRFRPVFRVAALALASEAGELPAVRPGPVLTPSAT